MVCCVCLRFESLFILRMEFRKKEKRERKVALRACIDFDVVFVVVDKFDVGYTAIICQRGS